MVNECLAADFAGAGNVQPLVTEIAYRLRYIEAVIKELKLSLGRERLDKQHVHTLLFEIRSALGVLVPMLERYNNAIQWEALVRSMKLVATKSTTSSTQFDELIRALQVPRIPTKDVENLSFHIDVLLALFTHASDKLSEEYYREKLYDLIPKVEAFVESVLNVVGSDRLSNLGRLIALTSRWGFGERWMVALAYLQALEVMVNKIVKEQNIKVPENAEFKERFRTVLEYLRNKNVELAKLDEKLPPVFWELRNKVVHAGYEPTEDELDTIVTWTFNIMLKLSSTLS